MTWLKRVITVLFDTKSVRQLKSEQNDLKTMVALAKNDERKEITKLHRRIREAREESKFEPSALANSLGWRKYD